jgi:hypothetical protein
VATHRWLAALEALVAAVANLLPLAQALALVRLALGPLELVAKPAKHLG